MARRGENIYKRKDDRWEGRYIKGRDPNGKTRFGYVYAKTYREVREKLTAARSTPAAPKPPVRRTFGDYCGEWLRLSRNRVKESSFVKYHNTVTRHLQPRLGWYLLPELTTPLIEEFSHSLLEEGMSAKTVRDILTVLRSILKYAAKQSGATPTAEVIYPKESKSEMRILTLAEQERFMQFLQQDMDTVKFGVLLALLTGMRIGEICALRWEHISAEEHMIHVCGTMQRLQTLNDTEGQKTRVTVGDTKSTTSNRLIPLRESVAALCDRMRAEDPHAFVLTADPLRFMEPRALQYRLKTYTKACDLSAVHFHVLRHTFATRCVEVGFELKSLSEILGHASAKVTLDRYVHPSMELKRQNMDKLAAVGL